jgi:hypothetical protein
MAAGLPSSLIRVSGRVIVNPTQAFDGGTYPYGGTEIGKTSECEFKPLGEPFRVISEGLGEATDSLEGDNRYVFTCMLRGWDDDAVELLFSGGFTQGAVTQHAVWSAPGSRTPGQTAYDRAVILAFIPDDPINANGLLIYAGVADWNEGAEVLFQRSQDFELPLAVECFRDSNANIVSIGRLPDLTLT